MLNFILYRIGQFIALHFPLKAGYTIARIVSDLHYLFAAGDRQATKENLKAIFPGLSDAEIRGIRKELFHNFAKYLVDFFRFEKIDKEFIKKNIRIENIHYYDEALKKGRGIIVLTAHIGNWELGGVVIALSGYDFWAVALPHKDKSVDRFFNHQRERKGVHVIPLGKAVRQSLNCLKDNRLIALVGDRDFNKGGRLVDFFAKKAYFPEGPAAFALKTGAPIIPGFMVRNADDTFTLRMEKPIEPDLNSDKEKEMQRLINGYKMIIEDYIRKYPSQWYMFRKFWIE